MGASTTLYIKRLFTSVVIFLCFQHVLLNPIPVGSESSFVTIKSLTLTVASKAEKKIIPQTYTLEKETLAPLTMEQIDFSTRIFQFKGNVEKYYNRLPTSTESRLTPVTTYQITPVN